MSAALGERVEVVLVSWNSARDLPLALASIPEGVRVIVVDNASVDDSAELARRAGARVIALATNAGFGLASNLGFAAGSAEAVLF
ncbi:MAG TPA: glycosyltransferase, partial [Thermoanaerobaculia bacterium]|nr:glycosyltransferase [Thermoanaerobaculia bacterium]